MANKRWILGIPLLMVLGGCRSPIQDGPHFIPNKMNVSMVYAGKRSFVAKVVIPGPSKSYHLETTCYCVKLESPKGNFISQPGTPVIVKYDLQVPDQAQFREAIYIMDTATESTVATLDIDGEATSLFIEPLPTALVSVKRRSAVDKIDVNLPCKMQKGYEVTSATTPQDGVRIERGKYGLTFTFGGAIPDGVLSVPIVFHYRSANDSGMFSTSVEFDIRTTGLKMISPGYLGIFKPGQAIEAVVRFSGTVVGKGVDVNTTSKDCQLSGFQYAGNEFQIKLNTSASLRHGAHGIELGVTKNKLKIGSFPVTYLVE